MQPFGYLTTVNLFAEVMRETHTSEPPCPKQIARIQQSGYSVEVVPYYTDRQLADMAMLMKQLVRAVKKNDPDSALAARAQAFLGNEGLLGSPLREDQSESVGGV